MHLSNISLAAVLSTAAAFTVHPINNLGVSVSRKIHKSSRSDQGWDNGNYLEALGGGESSIDNANQQYQNESTKRSTVREIRLQSMSRGDMDDDTAALFGANMPGMPDKPPKAPERDEENPMGGERFKKMMEKAQNGPSRPPAASQETYSPSPDLPLAPPATVAPVAVAADQMAYYQQQLVAWQQQMTAYAQFSAANPAAAASMTMPPPPPPPPGMEAAPVAPAPAAPATPAIPAPDLTSDPATLDPMDYVPTGSGNKDTYEITNPADVYFAQLKRDSQVRQTARRQGDLDTANKPFEDVGIKAIGNYLSKELIASRRKAVAESGGEFETSRDEMIIPYEDDDEEVDTSYTGVSYKQKMIEMKRMRAAKKGGQVFAAPVTAEPITAAAISAPVPVPEEQVAVPQVDVVEEEESGEKKPNFALSASENFDDSAILAPSMEDSEESRKSIRTLMGLILKHRGGPGFGAGRLKKAEFQEFEDSINEVTSLLEMEAGMKVSAPVSSSSPTAPVASSSPLEGSVACAEAVLGLYKSSDASSQEELLVPVRDALESALRTMNQEIESSSKSASAAVPSSAPVYATTMDFPDTYKVTIPEEEEQSVAAPAPVASDSDENTISLQNAYDTLKTFVGEEKYGLREIDSNEVSHIKDILHDLRGVIMDELDNGIPN